MAQDHRAEDLRRIQTEGGHQRGGHQREKEQEWEQKEHQRTTHRGLGIIIRAPSGAHKGPPRVSHVRLTLTGHAADLVLTYFDDF